MAKLLAGKLNAMSGEYTPARKLVVGYFAQHQQEELNLRLTPIETPVGAAAENDPGTGARPIGRFRFFVRQGADARGSAVRWRGGRG